jgi:antitoxin (DNA-binding transcriptional repressor) of toxin-antitoxin stability system
MHEAAGAGADPVVLGRKRTLTSLPSCVTLSHMKEVSIRELHRNTGALVRSAHRHGAILVRDRNVAVAKLIPVTEETEVNLFETWKPLKALAAKLNRPVRGTPVEVIIGEDRNR